MSISTSRSSYYDTHDQGGSHAVHVPDLRRRASWNGMPTTTARGLRDYTAFTESIKHKRQPLVGRRAPADVDRDDRARARRRDARHRRAVRRDQGAARRVLPGRREGRSTRRSRSPRAIPRRALRLDRGAPGHRLRGAERRPGRRGVPRGVRARGRDPDPRARRLRPRRGRRPGGVRDRGRSAGRATASRRARRVDRHDRPQPRDRPAAPRADAADEAAASSRGSRELGPRTRRTTT